MSFDYCKNCPFVPCTVDPGCDEKSCPRDKTKYQTGPITAVASGDLVFLAAIEDDDTFRFPQYDDDKTTVTWPQTINLSTQSLRIYQNSRPQDAQIEDLCFRSNPSAPLLYSTEPNGESNPASAKFAIPSKPFTSMGFDEFTFTLCVNNYCQGGYDEWSLISCCSWEQYFNENDPSKWNIPYGSEVSMLPQIDAGNDPDIIFTGDVDDKKALEFVKKGEGKPSSFTILPYVSAVSPIFAKANEDQYARLATLRQVAKARQGLASGFYIDAYQLCVDLKSKKLTGDVPNLVPLAEKLNIATLTTLPQGSSLYVQQPLDSTKQTFTARQLGTNILDYGLEAINDQSTPSLPAYLNTLSDQGHTLILQTQNGVLKYFVGMISATEPGGNGAKAPIPWKWTKMSLPDYTLIPNTQCALTHQKFNSVEEAEHYAKNNGFALATEYDLRGMDWDFHQTDTIVSWDVSSNHHWGYKNQFGEWVQGNPDPLPIQAYVTLGSPDAAETVFKVTAKPPAEYTQWSADNLLLTNVSPTTPLGVKLSLPTLPFTTVYGAVAELKRRQLKVGTAACKFVVKGFANNIEAYAAPSSTAQNKMNFNIFRLDFAGGASVLHECSLSPSPFPPSPSPSPSGHGSSKLLIYALIGLGVIIIGVVIGGWIANMNTNKVAEKIGDNKKST